MPFSCLFRLIFPSSPPFLLPAVGGHLHLRAVHLYPRAFHHRDLLGQAN